jgi:hypothetical protein
MCGRGQHRQPCDDMECDRPVAMQQQRHLRIGKNLSSGDELEQ